MAKKKQSNFIEDTKSLWDITEDNNPSTNALLRQSRDFSESGDWRDAFRYARIAKFMSEFGEYSK